MIKLFLFSIFFYALNSEMAQAQFVGMHCHLKMIKKNQNNSEIKSYGIGIQGNPHLNVHESKSEGEEVSQIIVSRGSSASLQVQTMITLSAGSVQGNVVLQPQQKVLASNVFITCKGGNTSMYDLKISLNSETSSLSTEISISKGSRVSLGSIVSDLNSKNKDISLNNGINLQETTGEKNYEYWLELD